MLIDKKYFSFSLFFVILSIFFVTKIEAAVSFEVITPKDGQKISMGNITVKGIVDPSKALKGNIYWETKIESKKYTTSTGSGAEGKIIAVFPAKNSSFGPNTITAKVEIDDCVNKTPEEIGKCNECKDGKIVPKKVCPTGQSLNLETCECEDGAQPPPPPPDDPDGPGGGGDVPVPRSVDPNDKIGPAGFGDQHFTAVGQVFPYTINFENVSTATAPAIEVKVIDQLDTDLDWRTFRLREIAFGKTIITIPENRSFYQTRFDLGPEHNNMLLDIDAGIDILTGKVHWYLITIDPATGQSPENPLLGFLPPNDENHSGEGHVIYTIRPKTELPTGTMVTNKATIFFDSNEPIDTNEVLNTIDGVAPSSAVAAITEETLDTNFTVTWSGQDDEGGSGLESYDVYVSDNEKAYELWIGKTLETSAIFTGQPGHSYRFYTVAKDNAGNFEAPPDEPDADTTVKGEITYYCDKDSDGHVNSSSDGTCAGLNCPPAGCQEEAGDDCNDNDNTVYPGAPELCDNKDNDCNPSTTDGSAEPWYGTQTTCGLGVCGNTGQFTCTNGIKTDTCIAGNPTGDDSNCNGIDENCDGVPDNNYVPVATNCGVGVCAATGQLTCSNGTTSDTCTPGIPTEIHEQSCSDGLDNDCDGAVDGDDSDCQTSINIPLKTGFNLISAPVDVPDAYTFLGLIDSTGTKVERIMRYNSSSGTIEEAYYEENGSKGGDNFLMVPGEGIIIYVKEDMDIGLSQSNCPAIDLKAGMNWIGVPCQPNSATAFILLQSIGDETVVSSIQRFNTVMGMFETAGYQNGTTTGINFPIKAGDGCYIYMKQGKTGFRP